MSRMIIVFVIVFSFFVMSGYGCSKKPENYSQETKDLLSLIRDFDERAANMPTDQVDVLMLFVKISSAADKVKEVGKEKEAVNGLIDIIEKSDSTDEKNYGIILTSFFALAEFGEKAEKAKGLADEYKHHENEAVSNAASKFLSKLD